MPRRERQSLKKKGYYRRYFLIPSITSGRQRADLRAGIVLSDRGLAGPLMAAKASHSCMHAAENEIGKYQPVTQCLLSVSTPICSCHVLYTRPTLSKHCVYIVTRFITARCSCKRGLGGRNTLCLSVRCTNCEETKKYTVDLSVVF